MAQKFALKTVQFGQTQKMQVVNAGAGISGQALVVQATEKTRYQIIDVVTLNSPGKLAVRRVGQDLHIGLPGGDADAPDIVLKGYFDAKDASLWGTSVSGEWMAYNTSSLMAESGSTLTESSVAAAESSLGTALNSASKASPSSVALQGGAEGLGTLFDSPWGLVGLAVLGGAVSLSKSGGGSSPDETTAAGALEVMRSFTNDAATIGSKTAKTPTLTHYKDAGITHVQDSTGDDVIALTTATGGANTALTAAVLNTALDRLDGASLSLKNVQAMVNAYYRISKEADGDATVDADVYPETSAHEDPTLEDYAAIGAVVPTTAKTLDLLNDAIGRLAFSKVDTAKEIDQLATDAENVMLLAQGAPRTLSDAEWTDTYTRLGLNGVEKTVVTALNAAVAATSDDGAGVDTLAELLDAAKPVLALQLIKDYTNDTGETKTKPAPTLQTYIDLGIKAFASLNNTADDARVPLTTSNTNVDAINSAMDELAGDDTLTKDRVQAAVDSYYRILQEADGDANTDKDVYADTSAANASNDDPLATDYTNVGVTVGATTEWLALLNDSVGRLSSAAVDTLKELKEVATAAETVMQQAAGQSPAVSDAKWVDYLTALGVTGVTISNVSNIKTAIAASGSDGKAVDTVAELQSLATVEILATYAGDSTNNTAPTLTDWNKVLLTANTSLADATRLDFSKATYWKTTNAINGLAALNSALASYTQSDVNVTLLQNIVDSYGRILQEADGSTTTNTDISKVSSTQISADVQAQDLTNVGVTYNQTTQSGVLLASVVSSLASTAVDTVDELNKLAEKTQNIMTQAAGGAVSYTDAEWISALGSLAFVGANTNNISYIKDGLAASADDGSGVNSYDEVQHIMGFARLQAYAADSVLNAAPTVGDYDSLGLASGTVLSANLNAYNSAVAYLASLGNTAADYTKVSNIVTTYNAVIQGADGDATATTPTLSTSDYANLGVTFNNSYVGTGSSPATIGQATAVDMFNNLVSGLTSTSVDTIAELQNIESVIDKILCLAANTKSSAAIVTTSDTNGLIQSDLGAIGLKGAQNVLASSSSVSDSEMSLFVNYVIYSDNAGADVRTAAQLQALLNQAILNG